MFEAAKSVNQADLTSECWSVQIWGMDYCWGCEFRDTQDCGGIEIRKTGKNQRGKFVPI